MPSLPWTYLRSSAQSLADAVDGAADGRAFVTRRADVVAEAAERIELRLRQRAGEALDGGDVRLHLLREHGAGLRLSERRAVAVAEGADAGLAVIRAAVDEEAVADGGVAGGVVVERGAEALEAGDEVEAGGADLHSSSSG